MARARAMDSEMIRAYLWQDVIRLGFHPASSTEMKKWIRQYCGSLREFWEVDSDSTGPDMLSNQALQVKINNASLIGFEIDCNIQSESKFDAQFLHKPSGADSFIMWSHDVDDNYIVFPDQKVLSSVNNRIGNRGRAVREFTRGDLVSVIDGLLLHPAVHMHLMSPIDQHEIRIGSGIGNSFQYLFNLRYQLCPIPEKRAAEKERLVDIFLDAISRNAAVAPSVLMAQPRL